MAAPRPWHEAARGPANDIVPWRKVARRQRRQAAVPPARSTPPRRARVPLAPRCCWPRLRALRTSGGRQPPPEGPRAGVPARRRGAPCLHGYGSFGAQCRHTAINMHATVDLVTRGSTTGHLFADISYRTRATVTRRTSRRELVSAMKRSGSLKSRRTMARASRGGPQKHDRLVPRYRLPRIANQRCATNLLRRRDDRGAARAAERRPRGELLSLRQRSTLDDTAINTATFSSFGIGAVFTPRKRKCRDRPYLRDAGFHSTEKSIPYVYPCASWILSLHAVL